MSDSDTTGRERLQSLIGEDYVLQWIIGHGGMSTVWLADDVQNQREVAVKVLRPEFSDNQEFLSRFRNEADAAESINSEHVVHTYDYREVPDPAGHTFCFIVMEYIRGETLADLLEREGALPEALALDVLEQAAHGLSVIHRMGMVHRDIKPGNMLITGGGQVKITDFGIAKAAAAVPLTRTGMVVGTAQYVSPEQAQGQEVTATSDVYSLGVVGYEMLAGKRPFTGDSSVSVAIAHINQAPPQMPVTVSAQARELIGIALRKDASRRFADGNEFALAISRVRLGQRPPQPRSAMVAGAAPAPTPSASTAMLGGIAQPTTVQPEVPSTNQQRAVGATDAAATGTAAAVGASTSTATPTEEKRGGLGLGIALAILLVAAIGGAVWAVTVGPLSGAADDEEETTEPTTITETITPTQEETSTQAPPTTTRPEPTTRTSSPTTSDDPPTPTTSEEPTTAQPTTSVQPPTSAPPTTEPDIPFPPTDFVELPTSMGTTRGTTVQPDERLNESLDQDPTLTMGG